MAVYPSFYGGTSLLLLALLATVAAGTSTSHLPATEPAWQPGTDYTAGQLVLFEGLEYRCLQSHSALRGGEPPRAPALWQPARPPAPARVPATPSSMATLIPMPSSVTPAGGSFTLRPGAAIYVDAGSPELAEIGQYLADKLNPATGYGLRVLPSLGAPPEGGIALSIAGADPALGEEGYKLTVSERGVALVAARPAGLFRGVQTIRQLLPPAIERGGPQPGPWTMPTGSILDTPRFAWRGAMLDVARHFFSVADVKRYIDLLAYYKINRFHMHLSDDQGWRLMINSWPRLATHGGTSEVGGGGGGHYSQEEYAELVDYAARRYITLVPEIDLPGHTNAALSSYAELNCSGVAPAVYTGIEVGFSSLCIDKELTYRFVDDVIREVAALTPGDYIHIGGDEAKSTSREDYLRFMARVSEIVRSHGKRLIGWEEAAQAELPDGAAVQYWFDASHAQSAVRQGTKLIMSPAARTYLDMKYDASAPLGLNWAGYTEVQESYSWDPDTLVPGISGASILGVEAPLWSETLRTIDDLEYMAFPRLPGLAEIGWSPAEGRSWEEYRVRLGAHGARLAALDINFYRSAQVPWR